MSGMTVFCDNYGCIFIDECGFCDCDKLSIIGGVCESSYYSERNATDVELDHIENKSRWFELFGTPEKAARTLAKVCNECDDDLPCSECPLHQIVDRNVYEPELLDWLRGNV